jgi:hypothetical protein
VRASTYIRTYMPFANQMHNCQMHNRRPPLLTGPQLPPSGPPLLTHSPWSQPRLASLRHSIPLAPSRAHMRSASWGLPGAGYCSL